MQNKAEKTKPWFKLDNAAKVFPGQNSSSWSNIFRASVTLDEIIDPGQLESAVKITLERFPCFDVRIRRGFFWNYFEKNPNDSPPVMHDIANPCHRMLWHENKRFLFRVYYYEKRIAVEFHHALSDAYGASRFLMTLAAVYLRMSGKSIPCGDSVLDVNLPADPEELEDAFLRYADSKVKSKRARGFVYHFKAKKLPKHHISITTGYMPVSVLKEVSHKYGVTITEFLAAVLLETMYKLQNEQNKFRPKPVSVQIPVNLRNTFPSKTLRNFSLCYCAKIDPRRGEYTFEEILDQVSKYLRYINNPKELNAMMAGNIGLERNPLMRALPLTLKNLAIGLAFKMTGEKTVSALISNVGIIKAPQELAEHIEKLMIMTGPGVINGSRCASVSFNGTLALSVANIFESAAIQREYFTALVKLGVPVKIESNKNFAEGSDE